MINFGNAGVCLIVGHDIVNVAINGYKDRDLDKDISGNIAEKKQRKVVEEGDIRIYNYVDVWLCGYMIIDNGV